MNIRVALNIAIEGIQYHRGTYERLAKLYHQHGEALQFERIEARQAARRYAELTEAIAVLEAERDKTV